MKFFFCNNSFSTWSLSELTCAKVLSRTASICAVISLNPEKLIDTLALSDLQEGNTSRNDRVHFSFKFLKLFIEPLKLTVDNAVDFHLKQDDVLSDFGDDLFEIFLEFDFGLLWKDQLYKIVTVFLQ